MATLLSSHAITTAQSIATVGSVLPVPPDCTNITFEGSLTYGSGGTDTKAFIQTSLDGGSTFIDVICFRFTTASLRKVANITRSTATAPTTATVGTMGNNTQLSGIIGDIIRIQVVTTGTYAGSTTLDIFAEMGSS